MTIALLDINDSNLQVWRPDLHIQSPAYALLDGSRYVFGNSARAAARLHPRQINTRYWWQLNTQALQPALGPARHTADLVHSHLLDLHTHSGEPEEFLLSVSSSLQREQLALLLGIIQQCPFAAVGLVNRSVAIASLVGGSGKTFHVELQLHQALISELRTSNGQIELVRNVPLPGCGLLQLQERLVEIIAAGFIRQTRFDPRRKAQSEQLLYDALPGALLELEQHSETNLEISGYRARILSSELATAGSRLFSAVAEAIGTTDAADRILIDPLVRLLPGIKTRIPQFEFIAADALPQALNLHMDSLLQRSETLNFVTVLPILNESIAPTPVASPPTETKPAPPPVPTATHLLRAATATPLNPGENELESDLVLYHNGGHWRLRGESSTAVRVNDTLYRANAALTTGDTIITPSGSRLTLITVHP